MSKMRRLRKSLFHWKSLWQSGKLKRPQEARYIKFRWNNSLSCLNTLIYLKKIYFTIQLFLIPYFKSQSIRFLSFTKKNENLYLFYIELKNDRSWHIGYFFNMNKIQSWIYKNYPNTKFTNIFTLYFFFIQEYCICKSLGYLTRFNYRTSTYLFCATQRLTKYFESLFFFYLDVDLFLQKAKIIFLVFSCFCPKNLTFAF